MADESIDDIERQGFAHIEREQWQSARQCFEDMLRHPMSTKREVKVRENILRTYQREGRMDEAIAEGERTLKMLEDSDFGQTMEGTFAHGQLLGLVKKMRRDWAKGIKTTRWTSPRPLLLLGIAAVALIVYFLVIKWLR